MKKYGIIIATILLLVGCAKEEDLPTPVTPQPTITTPQPTANEPYLGHELVGHWARKYRVHYSTSGTPTYDGGYIDDFAFYSNGDYKRFPNNPGYGFDGTFTVSGNSLVCTIPTPGMPDVTINYTYTITGDTLRRTDPTQYYSEEVFSRIN